jgi:8-oxo-dGTP pyrophosphatase MutT (NUDIX family)
MNNDNQNIKYVYPKQAIACVAAIVVAMKDNEKYILIQERWKQGGSPYDGRWEIPAGVMDIEYESMLETVKREVMEEAGIEVTEIVGAKEYDFSNGDRILKIEPYCISQQTVGGRPYVCSGFVCSANYTEPKAQEGETKNPQWVKASQLKEMIKDPDKFFPLIYPILETYLDISVSN